MTAVRNVGERIVQSTMTVAFSLRRLVCRRVID
jgi:hypothetical protein